jgi:hypothetical protein
LITKGEFVIVVTPDIDALGVPRDVFRFVFVNEFLFCVSKSDRGKIGIDVGMRIGLLLLDGIDGLVRTDFFLNNGVNIRCSSKRRIITGCITDDKYERL